MQDGSGGGDAEPAANAAAALETQVQPHEGADAGSTAAVPAESAVSEVNADATGEHVASEHAPMTEALDQTAQAVQAVETLEAATPAAAVNHEPDTTTSDAASNDVTHDVTPAPTEAQADGHEDHEKHEDHEDQKQHEAGAASHDATGDAARNIDA